MSELQASTEKLISDREVIRLRIEHFRKIKMDHETDEKRLKAALTQSRRTLESFQEAFDLSLIEEGRLEALEKSLAEIEAELTLHQDSYQAMLNAQQDLSASVTEATAALDNVASTLAALQGEAIQTERMRTHHEERQRLALQDKKKAADELDRLEGTKQDLILQMATQQEVVDEFISQASAVCSRVSIDESESEESIHQKLYKIQIELQKAERR